jgi:MazG family protein
MQDKPSLDDTLALMRDLRARCEWDRAQTHDSLRPYLVEEAHEVDDALRLGDPSLLREELGDLLLQVVFHAQMAADDDAFDIDDVGEAIVKKLIRRHPHVFGDVEVDSASDVLVNWERIKAEEKGEHGVEDEIPATLPALARAAKVQRRAAGRGFEWRSPEAAMDALREELEELEQTDDAAHAEEEIGDVLFATVSVARKLGVDPESALRRTVRKFGAGFDRMTALARERRLELSQLSDDELLALFREARTEH